jgi:hypothetical protein
VREGERERERGRRIEREKESTNGRVKRSEGLERDHFVANNKIRGKELKVVFPLSRSLSHSISISYLFLERGIHTLRKRENE